MNEEFGKWRSFFWPIHTYELKKVIPMFLMFFFISFNFSILRNAKDALIVTAPESGAETILFIKFWLVLPCSILFAILYAKLSNILSKEALFYVIITPFLLFFAIFALYLFPNRECLHPNEMANKLQSILPLGFKGFIAIFRNWTFALFFLVAELWGSIMISLMFWSVANEIMNLGEAKRFYSFFGIGANVALLCTGYITICISKACENLPAELDSWLFSIRLIVAIVILSGLGIIAIFWYINHSVLTDPRFRNPAEQIEKKKEKPKMPLKESLIYLLKSRSITLLGILVVAYGISINFIEIMWKSQLKLQYPNPNEYNAFLGHFSIMTGIITVFMMFFVGGNFIRKSGWGAAALITPVVLLCTGIVYFCLIFFKENLSGLIAMFGTTPLMLIVVVGAIQNILSKSCKYALFDPTKEMVYIPLDQEQKVKGKAVIDVVGSRLGKSGGSLIQQGFLIGFGSIALATTYLAILFIVVLIIWIMAVQALDKQLNTSLQKTNLL